MPWAVAEYVVVAVLAGLLVADVGGVDQPPPNPSGSSAKTEARQATRAMPNLEAGQDRPGVLRVAAAVARAVTKAHPSRDRGRRLAARPVAPGRPAGQPQGRGDGRPAPLP